MEKASYLKLQDLKDTLTAAVGGIKVYAAEAESWAVNVCASYEQTHKAATWQFRQFKTDLLSLSAMPAGGRFLAFRKFRTPSCFTMDHMNTSAEKKDTPICDWSRTQTAPA